MPSNRRGPTSNCGCCAPPCTCLIAKRSYEGTYSQLTIGGPSGTFSNPCNASGDAVLTSSPGIVAIDFDSDFCGESGGGFACPGGLSHYFGPVDGAPVGPGFEQVYLRGRNASDFFCQSLGYGTGECRAIDHEPDTPCFLFDNYGNPKHAEYRDICRWGGGVAFRCDGGNLGTPEFFLYATATYTIWANAFPVAPSGWTKTTSGLDTLYTHTSSGTTLLVKPEPMPFVNYFCQDDPSLFRQAPVVVYRLTAFSPGASSATSVTIPTLPYDPFGLMEGVSCSIS